MSYYDNICSRERFEKDTATHAMTILRDDGLYRHMRFKRPSTSSFYFDIITWPGYLAITGDMGANLFCRIDDMFEFFRTDRKHGNDTCNINPGYWAEKIQTDGRDSHMKWSVEKFNETITNLLNENLADCELDEDEKEELRDKVQTELLDPQDEYQAIENLRSWDDDNFTLELCDFPCDKQFTFHYIWRCRAIAWGIEMYDAKKSGETAQSEDHAEAEIGKAMP